MLAHLEPSSAITGGPWYTDNELDTEFIKLLMSACLKYITERVRSPLSNRLNDYSNRFVRAFQRAVPTQRNYTLSQLRRLTLLHNKSNPFF